jgi:hypothetical protein
MAEFITLEGEATKLGYASEWIFFLLHVHILSINSSINQIESPSFCKTSLKRLIECYIGCFCIGHL